MTVERAEIFDALLDVIAERVAAKLGASGPTFYSRAKKPPHHEWSVILAAKRRGELDLVKRGRCALLASAEYERWIAAGVSARGKKKRPRVEAVRDADADTLEQLGVTLTRQ